MKKDNWEQRAKNMRCSTCIWFVEKMRDVPVGPDWQGFGRCRRHAPTMSGFPAVFGGDFCGDHKLDENKA